MHRTTTHRRTLAAATTAVLALGLIGAGLATAHDGRGHDHGSHHQSDRGHGHGHDRGKGHGHDKGKQGRTVPTSKISIQLFSYAGWQREIGVEGLLDEISDIGYRNVEPFGGSYGDYSASEYRDLLKSYKLKSPTAHGSTNEATFDQTLADAKDRKQKYVGSGGFAAPGIGGGYDNVIATAETMNRLGERSVKNGTGKFFGHNHQSEFTTRYADPDTGEMKSAWEILVENTDPRYVTFQLDTFWAADAGVDVVALLEEHGDRVELLHIKDGDLNGDERGIPGDVGEGDMEWGPILRAAHGQVKLYVVERDGAPATPEFAEDSFEFLTSFRY